MTFAKRLRELRVKSKMTQTELATRSSLTSACINQLEMGRRKPLLFTAYSLSQALGLTLDQLTKGVKYGE